MACNNAPERPEPILTNQASTTTATTADATPPAKTPEPAQNAEGVWHYTCPNGCEGGGGSIAPCAKCGTNLAHNTAYHSGGNTTPSPNITTSNPNISSTVTQSPTNSTTLNPTANFTPPTPPKEPAQNAAGVWHYTCSNGCAGGGGSATACAGCGLTLTHNTSYHN